MLDHYEEPFWCFGWPELVTLLRIWPADSVGVGVFACSSHDFRASHADPKITPPARSERSDRVVGTRHGRGR